MTALPNHLPESDFPIPPEQQAALLSAQNTDVDPEKLNDLKEAFNVFNQATQTFQSYYQQLEDRIRELNLELEVTNQQLQTNQNYLAAILDNISAGVIVLDGECRIEMFNRAARQIFDLPENNGLLHINSLSTGLAETPEFQAALIEGFNLQRHFTIEHKNPDGECRWLDIQIVPSTFNLLSDKTGALLVIHDITELKQLAAKATLSSRLTAMGEIAMNVAHEVRNPLGSIELFSSVLQRELSDQPNLKELAGHILTGVRNIDNIVSNILLFARHEQIEAREIDPVELIEDIAAYLESALIEKEIQVDRQFRANGHRIIGDADLLKQVFLNIILNAIQAMQPGGNLQLRIQPREDTMIYQIIDDGCGVPSNNCQKIFDAFFTTRGKGTGLGLAISHRIVKAHQGAIEYQNRSTGGSIFTVSLPLKH